MKIAICWTGYSGYMAACWQALCACRGLQVQIYSPETRYHYAPEILEKLPIQIFTAEELSAGKLVRAVVQQGPDLIFVSGFSYKPFRQLLRVRELKTAKVVMCMDAAWRGQLRQFAARVVYAPYVRRTSAVVVAGERGRQYARYLGYAANRIFGSTYGCDYARFSPAMAVRRKAPEGWPRSFVYIGRYAKIKGLDTLLEAYRRYRRARQDAWPLHCFGNGDLRDQLLQTEGVVDHGFLQPQELQEELSRHGAMILPSKHEPWGVALAEAAASGLPIICSDACCSGLDIVRQLYDGLVFAAGDAGQLTRAMLYLHDHRDSLPEFGARAQVYAQAYSAENWARRWEWIIENVMESE